MTSLLARVLCVVLYEAQAEKPLAEWVVTNAVREGLEDDVDEVVALALPSTNQRKVDNTAENHPPVVTPIQSLTLAPIRAALKDQLDSAVRCESRGPPPPLLLCLVVAIFWDGHEEASKTALAELKQLSDKRWLSECTPPLGDRVEVLVQALDAKRGEATIMNNQVALVTSLRRKLLASIAAGKGWWHAGQASTRRTVHDVDSTAEMPDATADRDSTTPSSAGVTAAAPPIGEVDLSVEAIQKAIEKGQGESFFLLGDRDPVGLATKVEVLRRNCAVALVGCAPVMREPREVHPPHGSAKVAGVPVTSSLSSSAASPSSAALATTTSSSSSQTPVAAVVVQEFFLRRCCPPSMHLELRLAMCGNVDSGKSTLTSVLTRGCCDDGRGLARAFVFNHRHEALTGRTSSVSENHIGFSAEGGVVNYALLQPRRPGSALHPITPEEVLPHLASTSPSAAAAATHCSDEGGGGAHVMRHYAPQDLASQSAKVVTLYDLAGHERYLKTTVLGMTRNMPDYACIVISANNGIQRMTKEHLTLCLALKLPFFIVVTRIDATPSNVLEETLTSIHKLLKIPLVRKLPYPVRRHDEVVLAAKNLRHDRIAPIFEVSNVTGAGVPDVLQFINLLPMRKDWRAARALPKEMIIDSTFFVTGVGTVVGGIITQGVFRVSDTVLLGPDSFGHFRPAVIKSIHIKGVDSSAASAGSDAAFCLKKEKRSAIRKGNILADVAHPPKAFWQFEAEITILYHSTTITASYEPVIHATTVRQSARITYVAQEVLRTGDKSLARFHFLYRPEYMKEGQRLIFREGRTKGIGTVTTLICDPDEQILAKNKLHRKKVGGGCHAAA